MKPALIASAALAVVAVVALAALPSGEMDPEKARRMRGKDSYYSAAMEQRDLELVVRLNDTERKITFKTRITFQYQRGLEIKDAEPLIEKGRAKARDAVILYLSDFTQEELTSEGARPRMRRDLTRILEKALFPEEEARIRQVLFPVWQFLSTRN